jgi:hypothetical protein
MSRAGEDQPSEIVVDETATTEAIHGAAHPGKAHADAGAEGAEA